MFSHLPLCIVYYEHLKIGEALKQKMNPQRKGVVLVFSASYAAMNF